ncbi:YbfB/YjiJ family MFS transporter [Rhodoplanes serenus]|uniref:YbfB/YjiJ family MFS transporter n=1 Tax=Rhodoplanes serenus TaxID=200615 RepID=A0A9X4XQQ9_9BRAD|nr:YbfB/YjiJ family MFS transporter [Rhodoplanes serenus]MTW17894.1 YbfB/YjiJ family MFS transporter [Rhodoplanes serenus]
MHQATPPAPSPRAAIVAALAALFVGVGLARFAYTPLLPAVVAAGWFGPDQAAYLGASNLAGYLIGAIAGRRLAARTRIAAPVLMLVTAATFVACAWPLPFAWFAAWRFVSGLGGGALMVMAAPAALRLVEPARRGVAGGLVFAGVGLGIVTSGLVVPALLRIGLGETWMALGLLAALATVATARGWPPDVVVSTDAAVADAAQPWPTSATLVIAVYGTIAVALVPHMVFLVDFIARGLGAGIAAGAGWWVAFGLGATVGPALFGALGDRVGYGAALAIALTVQIAAVGIVLVSTGTAALAITSFMVGAYVPGSAPLVLGKIREIFHDPARQQVAWSRATVVFSVGQAAGAWLLSLVFAETGEHRLLFAFGTAAFALALLLDRIAAWLAARQRVRADQPS